MPAPSPAPATTDREIKRRRVLDVLDDAGASAVWLTTPASLGWYLDGARVHTSLLGAPIAAVRIDRDGDLLRVYANEEERLLAEEVAFVPTVESVPWHAPLVSDFADDGILTEDRAAFSLRAARANLLPGERARYAALSRETAAVLTAELPEIRPDDTELAVAARVSGALVAIGADPAVVMVAGATRLGYRHPLPTAAPIGDRAMVVVCARRHGLIANVTRWVRLRPASAAESDAERRIRMVEADAFAATRAGSTLGEVLRTIAGSYPTHGFADDEWMRHHQGGAAGYAGRDPRAVPDSLDLIQDGQPFAWNPTAPGHKIEDTVIIDDGIVTVLTRDGAWPEVDVAGIPRPIEWEL